MKARLRARASASPVPHDHLDPGRLQLGHAAAGHPRIGIVHGHHHPRHPGCDQGFAAGGRAAVVAAGLEGHHRGAALGPFSGLAQGPHFGVGPAGFGMEAFAHPLARGIEHHGPHHRIGAGGPPAQGGQLQGPLHPGPPWLVLWERGH